MRLFNIFKRILHLWISVFVLAKTYPIILAPFILMVVFDAGILLLLFLAPQPPLSTVFAPFIRAFWGESYLHYPANYLLLPRLFSIGKDVSGFVTGVLCTGIAVGLIYQAFWKGAPDYWFGIKRTVKRYFHLIALWGITVGTTFAVMKTFVYFSAYMNSKPAVLASGFLVATLTEMLFIYSIPSALLEKKNVGAALKRSVTMCRRCFPETFAAVFVPNLIFIPLAYLSYSVPALVENVFPEVVFAVVLVRIVVISVIDFLVTASATILFVSNSRKQGDISYARQ